MNLARNHLKWLSATLIALYVFDVPRFFIETWHLHLPLYGGRPPYLLAPTVVLLAGLIYIAKRRYGVVPLHPADPLFATAVAVCVAIAVYHEPSGGLGSAVDLAIFYSGFLLLRAHRDVFAEIGSIATTVVALGTTMGVVHLGLVGCNAIGLPILGADPAEFIQRNSISFVLVFGCFVVWFAPRHLPNEGRELVFAVPLLALAHVLANGARGALLALLSLAAGRYLLRADRSVWGGTVTLAGALTGLALVISGRTALELASPLLGTGDDWLSAVSRLTTNAKLAVEFVGSPLIGIGSREVDAVRFGGYPTHTYPLVLLSAFGLAGFIPVLTAIWFMAHGEGGHSSGPYMALALLALVTLSVNDLWPWLALAVGLVGLCSGQAANASAGRHS